MSIRRQKTKQKTNCVFLCAHVTSSGAKKADLFLMLGSLTIWRRFFFKVQCHILPVDGSRYRTCMTGSDCTLMIFPTVTVTPGHAYLNNYYIQLTSISLCLITKYETISLQLVCLRGFVRCWVAISVSRVFEAIELMEVSMAAVCGLWGLRKRKILGKPSNKLLFIVKVFPRTLLKQNRGELREDQLAVEVFLLL